MSTIRTYYPLRDASPKRVRIGVIFQPDLTGPIYDNQIGVASISRSSQGIYVVTLQDKYNSLEAWDCSMGKFRNSVSENKAMLKSEAVRTAGTVTVMIVNGSGNLSDSASSDGPLVYLTLVLKNTGISY